jgi:hypothetical protein
VKNSALILVMLGILIARQAYAEPVSSQPLTRADCNKLGLLWNDTANVCGFSSEELRTASSLEVSERSGQPLTRSDCDKAGMKWNDNANVCGEKTQVLTKTGTPVPSSILIDIDKTKQEMTVFLDGVDDTTGRSRLVRQVTRRHQAPLLPCP